MRENDDSNKHKIEHKVAEEEREMEISYNATFIATNSLK